MKKIFLTLAFLCALAVSASAQSNPPLTVEEADGSPKRTGITTIVVSNGTLTISGRTATIVTGGGGSGLTVGTTTITSGTATRLFYETAGNVLGQITGATSDGTAVTFTGGNLIATSPKIVTGINDTNGNELFLFTATASAINQITLANAAIGTNPTLTASGDDANVGLDFSTQAAGVFQLRGNSTAAATLRFYEDTDDGSNYVAFKAGTLAGDVTWTLPTADSSGTQCLSSNGSGTLGWSACSGGSGLTVGSTAIASGTAGTVLYESATNVLGEVANSAVTAGGQVTFDIANTSTTVNTTTPAFIVGANSASGVATLGFITQSTIRGNIRVGFTGLMVFNATGNDFYFNTDLAVPTTTTLNGPASQAFDFVPGSAGVARVGANGAGALLQAFHGSHGSFPGFVYIDSSGTGDIVFRTAGSTEQARIDTTGQVTFTSAARTSGVLPYFSVNTPADTTMTASTESVGVYIGGNGSGSTVTRQWATGALTTQREYVFVAPTYAFAAASTLTRAVTAEFASPIAGVNATLTNSNALHLIGSAATHVPLYVSANSGAASTLVIADFTRNGTRNTSLGVGLLLNGVEAPYGTSSLPSYRFTSGGNNGLYLDTGVGVSVASSTGGAVIGFGATGPIITATYQMKWGSSGFSTPDIGLVRAAAGVIRITDASTGAGKLVIGTSAASTSAADVYIVGSSASLVPLRVDSAATPSANIAEFTVNGSGGMTITKDGYMRGPNGATSAPAYSFSAFTNAGMYLRTSSGPTFVVGGADIFTIQAGNPVGIVLSAAYYYSWGSSGLGTPDLSLGRAAAATLQLGRDAASPVDQSIKAHDGSGTDIAGAALNIAGGKGTGTGAGGSVDLQTAIVGTTGTSLNSLVTRYLVNGTRKTLTDASTNLFEIALSTLQGCMGTIRFEIYASDATDVQVRRGVVQYSAVNKAGSYTTEIAVVSEAASASTGTLTATWGITGGTNKVTIDVTPSGSLTETTYYIIYTIENNSESAITIL